MDLLGRKMKKICSIFFHFFPWAQMTLIWIFLVKLRMDIKMANPWLHRNHQYRSKYYVLLSFLAYWKSPFRVRTPCSNFEFYNFGKVLKISENIVEELRFLIEIHLPLKSFLNQWSSPDILRNGTLPPPKNSVWYHLCTAQISSIVPESLYEYHL